MLPIIFCNTVKLINKFIGRYISKSNIEISEKGSAIKSRVSVTDILIRTSTHCIPEKSKNEKKIINCD